MASTASQDKEKEASQNKNSGQQDCALFRLPAELRNTIYELCVLQDLVIATSSFRQPQLLGTCREIRKEVAPIYYLSNNFAVMAVNCDVTLTMRFMELCESIVPESSAEVNFIPIVVGRRNWANVVRWCKLVFDNKVWGLHPIHRNTITALCSMSPNYSADLSKMALVRAAHRIASKAQLWEECWRSWRS